MKTFFAAMIAAGLALAPAAMAQDAATSAKSKSAKAANKTGKTTGVRYRPSARSNSYSGPTARQEVSPETGIDHTRM